MIDSVKCFRESLQTVALSRRLDAIRLAFRCGRLHLGVRQQRESRMTRRWSVEHLVRRVDRYYLLAAAAKLPALRKRYLAHARHYRNMLPTTLSPAA